MRQVNLCFSKVGEHISYCSDTVFAQDGLIGCIYDHYETLQYPACQFRHCLQITLGSVLGASNFVMLGLCSVQPDVFH